MRNPWGKNEGFNGNWSDKSDSWTDAFKAEVDYFKNDDGIYFISAEDYHSNMKMTHANPDV